MVTVTSARGSTVKLALAELLARFGSAVALELTRAVLVRLPALPPGRTCTVTTGQFTPVVQTGRLARVQVSRRLVPPVLAVEQLSPA